MSFQCTIKGFLDKSYGKYGSDSIEKQVLMEFNQMFPYLNDYLPDVLKDNKKFVEWLE